MSQTARMFFDFVWRGGQDGDSTVSDILELKRILEDEEMNPRKLTILKPPAADHERILTSFMDVFRHCVEHNIQWETLELHLDSDGILAFHFARPLLFAANMLNLFSRCIIQADATIEGQDVSECDFLLSGITLNRRLEFLELRSNPTGGQVTMGDYRALNGLLQTTTTLKELNFINMTNFEPELFSQGLKANSTIEKLSLSFIVCNVPDECLATIIDAMQGKDNFTTLGIASSGQFGDESSRAIKELTTNSSSLVSLSLQGFEYFSFDNAGTKLNTKDILQGIQQNDSLNKVLLADALDGDDIFSSFFEILPECPKLKMLHLWEPNITKLDLEKATKINRLKQPIVLGLSFSSLETQTQVLGHVLQCHPELRMEYVGFKGQSEYDGLNGEHLFVHICDLNWHGKYLMDIPEFPLSMWPTLLQKANTKPNVIYEFLKGPAFVEAELK